MIRLLTFPFRFYVGEIKVNYTFCNVTFSKFKQKFNIGNTFAGALSSINDCIRDLEI